jgi:Protein of unknown function (DUF3592)
MSFLNKISSKVFRPEWPALPTRPKLSGFKLARMIIGETLRLLLYLSFMGVIFYFLIKYPLQIQNWTDASCLILETKLVPETPSKDSFQLEARVQQLNGKLSSVDAQTSAALRFGVEKDSTQQTLALYKPGTVTRCLIDPTDKNNFLFDNELLTYQRTLMSIMFLPLLLIFPVTQTRAIYKHLRDRNKTKTTFPLSEYSVATRKFGNLLTFKIAGSTLVAILIMFQTQYSAYLADNISANWANHECTIVFKSKQNGGSNDYKKAIVYSYSINNQEYRSDRYFPHKTSNSSYENQDKIDRLDQGDKIDCFVNLDNPVFAKLSTSNRDSLFERFYRILPYVVLIIFITWLYDLLCRGKFPELSFEKSSDPERIKLRQWFPLKNISTNGGKIQYKLSTKNQTYQIFRRVWSLPLFLFASTGLFFWMIGYDPVTQGLFLPSLFSVLILIIIFASYGRIKTEIQAALPLLTSYTDFEIEFIPGMLCVGQKTELQWNIKSRSKKFSALKFIIRGKEVSKPSELPTKKENDEKEFFSKEIISRIEESNTTGNFSGNTCFTLPENLPHSLSSPHFAIVWQIEILGIFEEKFTSITSFDLEVLPMGYKFS